MKVKNAPLPAVRSKDAINISLLAHLKDGEAEFYEGATNSNLSPMVSIIGRYLGVKFTSKAMEHQGKNGVMVWRVGKCEASA